MISTKGLTLPPNNNTSCKKKTAFYKEMEEKMEGVVGGGAL